MGINLTSIKLKTKKYFWVAAVFFISAYFGNFFDKLFNPVNDYLLGKLKGPLKILYEQLSRLFNIKLPLYSLFLAILLVWLCFKIYWFIESRKKKLRIVKAFYGKNGKYIDIASRLNEMIEDNRLKVVLSNAIAGDPLVTIVKEGIIEYKYMGVKDQKIYNEGDVINLP